MGVWARQIRLVLGIAVALGAIIFGFIVVMDPYDNVVFSPALDRAPVSANQRYAYPALARNPEFNALVLGTSTARLLDPQQLNQHTGLVFANLAMNSATPYEQWRMHELFVRQPRKVVALAVAVDLVWCDDTYGGERYTERGFPEWLYDEDRFGDVRFLFNDKALENAVRMLELLRGIREPRFGRDGYRDFLADRGRWDADAVRQRLHGDSDATTIPRATVMPDEAAATGVGTSAFRRLERLVGMLEATPRKALKVLFLPPLHARYIATEEQTFAACKARLRARVEPIPNTVVLDYLFYSPLTTKDEHYADALHFTHPVARRVERDIGHVAAGGSVSGAAVRMLVDTRGDASR